MEDAEGRGRGAEVRNFEARTAASRAVVNRSALEAARLASSDRELQSTFYELLKAQVRLPYGEEWDRLREIADAALFTGYRETIRFAALSLDGAGLFHYGDCSLELREDMIAHRASVFEENSTLFLKQHHYDPPLGHRATWGDRSKLCVSKLAGELRESSSEPEFSVLLLSPGETPAEDRFVEVHIWGPLSLYCLKRGLFRRKPDTSPTLLLAAQEIFTKAGLDFEVLS
ncbi:MAG TPA: hypothetical protein VF414_17925 [Thermoanaerobaculia bacterium]